MRSETSKAGFGGIQLDHMPSDALRDPMTPAFTRSADTTEYLSRMQLSCMDPRIQGRLDPFGHGNRSNVPAFANKIDYGPMLLPLLQVREL
jgi:hypothetical protein